MSDREKAAERVLEKVNRPSDSDCWLWHAYTTKDGRGQIRYNGTQYQVNRIVYEYYKGPLRKGTLLRPTCKNKHCVNPFHNFPVVAEDSKTYAKRYREAHPELFAHHKRIWVAKNRKRLNERSKALYYADIKQSRKNHTKWRRLRDKKEIQETIKVTKEKLMSTVLFYEFSLPLAPFSINAMYYAKVKVKTKEYREWERKFAELIEPHKEALKALAIEGNTHFKVTLHVTYDKSKFFNDKGRISGKTQDVSNFEKPFVDQLFLYTMGIDDRFISEMHSKKQPGEVASIYCKVEVSEFEPHDKAG